MLAAATAVELYNEYIINKACHPEFLSRFRESHNRLMWDPGSLSTELRHMIAIMAASRHSCQYLADIHRRHFLDCGGDPDWLKGPEHLYEHYPTGILSLFRTLVGCHGSPVVGACGTTISGPLGSREQAATHLC